MKTLLALVGLVAIAALLFVALNHERFFPKRALRPDFVNTPLRSPPPLVDQTPPPRPENPVLPVGTTDTNSPTAAIVGVQVTAGSENSWEAKAAAGYSTIIEKIRKERSK